MMPYFGLLWLAYQIVPIMSPSPVIPNIPELLQTESMKLTWNFVWRMMRQKSGKKSLLYFKMLCSNVHQKFNFSNCITSLSIFAL